MSSFPRTDNDDNEKKDGSMYANRHLPAFLQLKYFDEISSQLKSLCPSIQSMELVDGRNDNPYSCQVQIIQDGSTLTSQSLKQKGGGWSLQQPMLVTDTPESIGMKIPTEQEFGIREVSEMIGPRTPVRVIDVASQHELEGWCLGDLVDYFEDEDRLQWIESQQHLDKTQRRKRRTAAIQATQKQQSSAVLNQISLEFSRTPLRQKVLSPTCVRDMDWIDTCWPNEYKQAGQFPAVQYYCLTSAAGCYTDFHIDFGGTSVWYHVLMGQKQFCLIPPTAANLNAYEDWLCSKQQANTFLPDMLPVPSEAFRIALEPHQTLIIPSGWIHSVYSPKDCLVFGGNFLHGLDVTTQIEVFKIETKTHVLEEYRFPYFIELHFCAAYNWFKRIRDETAEPLTLREWQAIPTLCDVVRSWWVMKQTDTSPEKPNAPTVMKLVESMLQESSPQLESLDNLLDQLLTAYNEGYDKHAAARAAKSSVTAAPTTPRTAEKQQISIRLRVQQPPLPTPGLNTGPKADSTTNSSPRFRIRLSAKSVEDRNASIRPPAEIPTRRAAKVSREGLASFPDESTALADEEWVPESKPPKPSPNSNSKSKPVARSSLNSPPKKKAKAAPVSSARQRLMKKVM